MDLTADILRMAEESSLKLNSPPEHFLLASKPEQTSDASVSAKPPGGRARHTGSTCGAEARVLSGS